MNHEDQQQRIRAGEVEDPSAVEAVQSHLDSLARTPSTGSPGSLSRSSTKMDSPDSETRRANVCLRFFPSPVPLGHLMLTPTQTEATRRRNQEFVNLIKADQHFHSLMSNLDGIREWWESNRVEWQKMREPVDVIDATIQSLEDRIRTVTDMQYVSPLHQSREEQDELYREKSNCRHQILELNDEKERHRLWFVQREQLMRAVRRQFKELKAESQLVFAGAPRPTVLSIAERSDFVYDLTRETMTDMEKTSW